MPFCGGRPEDGWHHGSIHDMDYPLLGAMAAICSVFIGGSGAWMLYRLDLGLGYSCKPHHSGYAPEANSFSALSCLVSGTIYAAKTFDFFDGGGTPFSFNWYWYLDYVFTCPLILLDVLYTLEIPHKLRFVFAVIITLWCGVAAFVTPSAFRFGYYAVGCVWFVPFSFSLLRHVKQRYQVYPPKCQKLLFWACTIFFGFWPLFPILFLFSWLGTGHIDQQAFTIIHAFLDLFCKTVFGLIMTFFRLELEEHTEVLGLPLNEPKGKHLFLNDSAARHEKHLAGPGTESLTAASSKVKLQWIQKLLAEALTEASQLDLDTPTVVPAKVLSSATPERHLPLRQQKKEQQERGEKTMVYPQLSSAILLGSPAQEEEQGGGGGAKRERGRALVTPLPGDESPGAASLSPAQSTAPARRRASSRQRARASASGSWQPQDGTAEPAPAARETATLAGPSLEGTEHKHRRSLSRSSSTNLSPSRPSHYPTREGGERLETTDRWLEEGMDRERSEERAAGRPRSPSSSPLMRSQERRASSYQQQGGEPTLRDEREEIFLSGQELDG